MKKAIKEGGVKRISESIAASAHTINLSLSDIWLSYVLRVTLCHLMTICLEKKKPTEGRARERMDTVLDVT